MKLSGNDILGTSAYDPKKERAKPSIVETVLEKVVQPEPPEKEFFISPQKPAEDAVLEGVIDRQRVVDEALRHTNRVSRDTIARITDFLFNDGYSLATIQELASLKTSGENLAKFTEILEEISPGKMANIEHIEGVAAVARAILNQTMTHRTDRYSALPLQVKTPFLAWRVKEAVLEITRRPPIVVEPVGFDNDVTVKQFHANFNAADLVLWNKDIWCAAIRGYENAIGTSITAKHVDAILPMFWQFEVPVQLSQLVTEDLRIDNQTYNCIGFVLLPVVEDFVELKFPDHVVKNVRPEGNRELITVDTGDPEVQGILEEAGTAFKVPDHPLRVARRGISISIIFGEEGCVIPRKPEVRFLRPLFEDDIIKEAGLAMILAAVQFLTLKYVAQDSVGISKRELKADRELFKKVRKGKTQVPPIKVINLRRSEVRTRKEADDDVKQKREWSCHWFVDPHWRRQWIPTRNRHELRRILTYVKGDLNKPLKAPREKVYKAVR